MCPKHTYQMLNVKLFTVAVWLSRAVACCAILYIKPYGIVCEGTVCVCVCACVCVCVCVWESWR